MSIELDPTLLEIIVCPACRSDLALVDDDPTAPELVCEGCGLAYPIRDGIPVMLVDEARKPT
jgi:uncharacterized protein YbaR (Trm112 family)